MSYGGDLERTAESSDSSFRGAPHRDLTQRFLIAACGGGVGVVAIITSHERKLAASSTSQVSREFLEHGRQKVALFIFWEARYASIGVSASIENRGMGNQCGSVLGIESYPQALHWRKKRIK